MDSNKEQITVTLKRNNKGFGLSLTGQYPCTLTNVQPVGAAHAAGLCNNDSLLFIADRPCAHMPHEEIAALLAEAGNILNLTIARPVKIQAPVNNKKYDVDWTHEVDSEDADSDSQVWQEQRKGAENRLRQGIMLQSGSLRKQTANGNVTSVHKRRSGSSDTLGNNRRRSAGTRFMQHIMGTRQSQDLIIGSPDQPGPFTCAGVMAAAKQSNKQEHIQSSSLHRPPKKDKSNRKSMYSLGFNHDSLEDIFPMQDEKSGSHKSRKDKKPGASVSCSNALESRCLLRSSSQPEGVNNLCCSENETDEADDVSESTENNRLLVDLMGEEMIFQCVLVYIGAVPVPHLSLTHRHIVRSALLSLQTQKAKARTVLFQIYSHQIVVTNSRCSVTHRIRTSCIVFSTPCAESTQYFGICTVHSPLDQTKPQQQIQGNCVCHMFAADPELHLHSFHYHYARKFNVQCSRDPESGFCLEFPYVSGPVLHAIAYARKSYQVIHSAQAKAQDKKEARSSPPAIPPRSRTYASSNNSDSGIGDACILPDGSPPELPTSRSKIQTRQNRLRVTFEETRTSDVEVDSSTPPSTPSPVSKLSSPESEPPPVPPKRYLMEKLDTNIEKQENSLLEDVFQEIGLKEQQRKIGSTDNCSTMLPVEESPPGLHRSFSTDVLHIGGEVGAGDHMDFDNMLHDHQARAPFQVFLQHQFCGENLTFWIAVEHYKKASDKQRDKLGTELYDKHFSCGCSEPVNVDCAVMQKIKEAAQQKKFTKELFDMAQHQIFHLMKYDCWPRFLKSELATGAEKMSGGGKETGATAMDKSRDQKRRSLLPGGMKQKLAALGRGGGEKKKKEEKDAQSQSGQKKQASWRKHKQNSMPSQFAHSTHPSTSQQHAQSARPDVVPECEPRHDASPIPGAIHGSASTCSAPTTSRTPQTTLDSMDMTNACLVLLPTTESVYVPVHEDMTVRQWLHSISMQHGVNPQAAELYDISTGDQMDASLAVNSLRGRQCRLEAAVLFKVDLPMSNNDANITNDKPFRKLVAVRARPESAAGLVLRPVLSRYGLDLDKLVVCMADSTEVLPNSAPISRADARKLIVLTNKQFQEWVHSDQGESSCPSTPLAQPNNSHANNQGDTQSIGSGTGGSSGLSGMLKFVRSSKSGSATKTQSTSSPPSRLTTTSSSFHGQFMQRKSLGGIGSFSSGRSTSGPVNDKRLTLGNALEFKDVIMKEQALADLVEKAQSSRLDDQRVGSLKTQFDMPDFLKRSSSVGGGAPLEEVFVPATEFFNPPSGRRPEHRCVVAVDPPPACPPSPREIQVVYDSNESPANVSIVAVGEVPSQEKESVCVPLKSPKTTRPPPPPYPGAKVPVEGASLQCHRPKPIYVPTTGEANELGGWKVDYV